MKKSNKIILELTRNQFETIKHSLEFEEDTANLYRDYQQRNKIRKVIEIIKQTNE